MRLVCFGGRCLTCLIKTFKTLFFVTNTQTELVPESGEINNMIGEVVYLARQINLEVDSDGDNHELLDSHNRELTIVELIEMHEQEQDIEEFESLDLVQLELDRKPQFD